MTVMNLLGRTPVDADRDIADPVVTPFDRRVVAVGAVVYEMLACRQAFPGGLENSVITRIVEASPEPLDRICEGLDPEVIRIVTVGDGASRRHYSSTLFSESEAQVGRCTSRGVIYTAAIAAGLMVHQLARNLRNLRIDRDISLNLLAGELTCS